MLLPHFGVFHPCKCFTRRSREVQWDFPQRLTSGPDLLNQLPGVLMRFRVSPVGYKGDIHDMFLTVKIRDEDQHAHCFSWWGHDRKKESDVYRMTSLIFGAKCSPCNAIFTKNKNVEAFRNCFPAATANIVVLCPETYYRFITNFIAIRYFLT